MGDRELAAGAALLLALAALPERHRYVVVQRHVHGRSCAELARAAGVTGERIRQIDRAACTKLAAALAPFRDDLLEAA